MTKKEPLRHILPGELGELRAAAERKRDAEEALAQADADLLNLAVDLREEFPGRGTVTAMADVISEVLGDSKDRRTQLSRAIGTVHRARMRASGRTPGGMRRLQVFPEDES